MIHARPDYNRIQDPENKIPANEPVILFRAQDRHTPKLLAYYLLLLGKDEDAEEDIILSVVRHIRRVQEWQDRHGCKTPDL